MAFSVFKQRQQAKHFQLEELVRVSHLGRYRPDCDVTDHQMGVLVCTDVSATEMV